ncbi:MAG: Hsp70 family protein, partial [archaeon]|nr:Hsp70 family protein [archaeon]
MSNQIGIDLGTTYSGLAHIDDKGIITADKNNESFDTTPSVIYVDDNGSIMVGSAAKDYLADYGKGRIISEIKNKMGTDYKVPIDGKDYTPVEVSALILKKLIKDYNDVNEVPITEAVITVPTTFGQPALDATIDAGRIAGLNKVVLLHEPIAAALSYGVDNESCDGKRILVFDLGGGTFDISIIDIKDGEYFIRAKAGKSVGGKDWDKAITDMVLKSVSEKTGVPVETLSQDEIMMSKLEVDSERVKIRLTSSESNRVTATYNHQRYIITIARKDFEENTTHLVKEVMDAMKRTLKAKKMTVEDMDLILMVGGSSRMPMIQEAIRKECPENKIRLFEPNLAVEKGAAIYSKSVFANKKEEFVVNNGSESNVDLTSPEPEEQPEEEPVTMDEPETIRIHNIIGKTYGIKARSKDSKEEFVSNIIFRDSAIPLERGRKYMPASETQTKIKIAIYESDTYKSPEGLHTPMDMADNVGEFVIELPEEVFGKKPEIMVTFKVDENGILTAISDCMGQKNEWVLQRDVRLTEEQIEEAKKLTEKLKN